MRKVTQDYSGERKGGGKKKVVTFFKKKKKYVTVLAEERGRDSYVCRLCGNSCVQWYVGLLTSVV